MITVMVADNNFGAFGKLLKHWPSVQMPSSRILGYGVLDRYDEFPSGVYVFADLERLTNKQLRHTGKLSQRLASAGDCIILLNDPRHTLRRYDLLSQLHARGINRFRAFRVADGWQDWDYPVFVREENAHGGSLSGLIRNEAELRRALMPLLLSGRAPENLLIVEYCETRNANGVYRKYSAFRVGEHIVPRHILFSHDWVVKDADLTGPTRRDEVYAYLETNPHEERLREIFEIGRAGYGRIDYALLDGEIQVWEINTNPVVVRPDYPRSRREYHEAFARRFAAACRATDAAVPSGAGTTMEWDAIDPLAT